MQRRCVSPVLIVVAAMTHGRSVFVSPADKRAEASAARAQLTANSTAAKSDHLAIIAAFNGWAAAWAKGGRQQAHSVSRGSRVTCNIWAGLGGVLVPCKDIWVVLQFQD